MTRRGIQTPPTGGSASHGAKAQGGAIPEAVVLEVKRRQGFRCATCGRARRLEVHHLKPRGMGGGFRSDDSGNLLALCSDCHRDAGYTLSKFTGEYRKGK